jgi:hypothetical protein
MPVAAQEVYDPSRIVKVVETADLVAAVNSLGDNVIEADIDRRAVIAMSPEGLRYVVFGTACDIEDIRGCRGVMIEIRFDSSPEVTAAGVNKANMNEGAILTWLDEEEWTLAFSRYVIVDHGITMANLRENIGVLRAIIPSAMAYAKGQE